MVKFADGGFNRHLLAMFRDGYAALTRIPFRFTTSARYAIASEAAPLAFLRSHHNLPVPKVLAYSRDVSNPVGVEYLVLEKVEGRPLSEQMGS